MEKTLTLGQVLNIFTEINSISDMKLSLNKKYELKKFSRPLVEAAKQIDEMHQELIKEYGVSERNAIKVPEDKQKEFFEKWNTFLNTEEIFNIENFDLAWVGELETTSRFDAIFDLILETV